MTPASQRRPLQLSAPGGRQTGGEDAGDMLVTAHSAARTIAALGEAVAARLGDDAIAAIGARGVGNVGPELRALDPSLVDEVVAELSQTVRWSNDGRCAERALASALRIGERAAGGVDGFVSEATGDALSAGIATVNTSHVLGDGRMVRHMGALVHIQGEQEPHVIDLLYSPRPIPLSTWASKPGTKPGSLDLFSPFVEPVMARSIPGTSFRMPPKPVSAEYIRKATAIVDAAGPAHSATSNVA